MADLLQDVSLLQVQCVRDVVRQAVVGVRPGSRTCGSGGSRPGTPSVGGARPAPIQGVITTGFRTAQSVMTPVRVNVYNSYMVIHE